MSATGRQEASASRILVLTCLAGDAYTSKRLSGIIEMLSQDMQNGAWERC